MLAATNDKERVNGGAGETDREQDTVAFDALEGVLPAETKPPCLCYEVRENDGGLFIRPDFVGPIEIRVGQPPDTSPCYLVHGSECPQLNADYILVQPDVLAVDSRRGWVPFGGIHCFAAYLGRTDSPELKLGADVSREHCDLGINRGVLTIGDSSRNGTWVIARPDDLLSREEASERQRFL